MIAPISRLTLHSIIKILFSNCLTLDFFNLLKFPKDRFQFFKDQNLSKQVSDGPIFRPP